jgi:hypothetical protein
MWPTYKCGQLHTFYCNCAVQRQTTWRCTDSTVNIKYLEFGKWKTISRYTVSTAASKYRVIHKSLRNFRNRLRNNKDRHGRKDISSTCKLRQKLWVSVPLLTCSPSTWPSWLPYRTGRASWRDFMNYSVLCDNYKYRNGAKRTNFKAVEVCTSLSRVCQPITIADFQSSPKFRTLSFVSRYNIPHNISETEFANVFRWTGQRGGLRWPLKKELMSIRRLCSMFNGSVTNMTTYHHKNQAEWCSLQLLTSPYAWLG